VTVAAIVLAAGRSTRFGTQKLLAPLAGEPLVRWTAQHIAASSVGEIVVVVGHDGSAVRAALEGVPVRCVMNPRYAEGLSTSVHAGVWALSPGVSAVLIALGDQPTVTAEVCDRLVHCYRRTAAPIVAASYRGVRGNPVLFDASLFPELLATTGDQGARAVIARDPARVATAEIDTALPADVDEATDLATLLPEMQRLKDLAPPDGAPGAFHSRRG
jgi:molybdenum cofactor cytidylyltransferase